MQIKELGHIVLYVRNVEISAAFYRDTLGFKQVATFRGSAMFSAGRTHHELLLIEVGGDLREVHHPEPGLYHIGFKIGDGAQALRDVYKELVEKGVHILGATDHTITHGIYILDPDENELELYADISDEWKTNPQAIAAPAKALQLE
jgi:catechol-2,3-dioxygenase